MAFSGIIELLGVKELAEYDTTAFKEEILQFKYKLQETAKVYKVREAGNILIYNFRDYCYIQSPSFKNLISFLQHLQVRTMGLSQFSIRSAVTEGELGFEATPGDVFSKNLGDFVATNTYVHDGKAVVTSIRTVEYLDIPARLYGIVERFKGIGIFIDQETVEVPLGDEWVEIKREYCFDNFYISDTYKLRYEYFLDVKINVADYNDEEFSRGHVIDKIVKAGKQAKFTRLYIPILLNVIKNCELRTLKEEDKEQFYWPLLDDLKRVTGYELVYMAILAKFFEGPFVKAFARDTPERELVYDIQGKIRDTKIVFDILSDDSPALQIPKEIISYSKRVVIKQRLYDMRREEESRRKAATESLKEEKKKHKEDREKSASEKLANKAVQKSRTGETSEGGA